MIQTTLSKCAAAAGFSLSEEQLSQFSVYADMLLDWNEKMNLTAITDPFEIAVKHFADSLYGLQFLGKNDRIIDVGTGAGFPGIPLKIARPELSCTLLDSLNKRLRFLDAVVSELKLSDTETIHSRAEDGAAKKSPLREGFDVCVSRAVSQLNVLSEYCLPYVKTGGLFLAYKGGGINEELDEAMNAIKTLGGEIDRVFRYTIPETDIAHSIVVIRKTRPTPPKFPRLQGKIAKQPL